MGFQEMGMGTAGEDLSMATDAVNQVLSICSCSNEGGGTMLLSHMNQGKDPCLDASWWSPVKHQGCFGVSDTVSRGEPVKLKQRDMCFHLISGRKQQARGPSRLTLCME